MRNLIYNILAIILSCVSLYAQKNNSKYVLIPDHIYKSSFVVDQEYKILLSKGKKAKSYLPKGFSKKGNVDYTVALQKAIDENDIVIMPEFPILVNEKGLILNNNSKILFQKESMLFMKANDKANYAVFLIQEIKNVTIYNPRIKGDKFSHLNSDGQWGIGIRIFGGQDVKIINPIIEEMWGDGIYIGGPRRKESQNVFITSGKLDNNRRNAISITSANGVSISNIVLANTDGNPPKAGIDIEPNNNFAEINNIKITDITSYYNAAYGIVISLKHLVGVNKKEVNITIQNPKIYGGNNGIVYPLLAKTSPEQDISGKVLIENPIIFKTKNPIRESSIAKENIDKEVFKINVKVKNLKVVSDDKLLKIDQIKLQEAIKRVKSQKNTIIE